MGCKWYGTTVCSNERRCDGEGYVNCKVSSAGIVHDKMRGEYARTASNPHISRLLCLSCIEKKVSAGTNIFA